MTASSLHIGKPIDEVDMDLLIAYEDKAALDNDGNVYIGTAFSNAALDSYLQHFDNIIMLMRCADIEPDDMEKLNGMNKITNSRISVVFLPNPTANLKSYLSVSLRREYKRIVTENITPDRAVIVRVPSTSGNIAARYCRKIGKTYLAEAIGCPWDSLWNHSLRGKLMAPFAWLNLRRTMKNAPYSVYVTSEFLQKRYPTKGTSAAISDVELQPMDDKVLEKRLERIESQYGKLKIATGGALVSYKGQQFVIEALAKLKEKGNTNFEYHMAGSGDEQTLRELAEKCGVSEQIVFEGRLPHDKMFQWLDDMDVYIQPSLVESMPRALIEALSRGLPAFATRVGGMTELAGEDNVFEKRDVAAITDFLSKIDKDKAVELAQRNFDCALGFCKDKLEKQRFDFYAAFAAIAKESKT